jgi:glycosyltransferase involved in cell wall biosynthesis
MAPDAAPEIAVVVPSHDRPIRLLWLLNALAEQTLARDRFEVVVAHDSRRPETERVLREHPLGAAGVLRHVRLAPSAGGPGSSRNAGWREARAPLIAFTDDDCRPPPQWLERALAAARRHEGAIVQGTTMPDPDEIGLERAAPHAHTRRVRPPTPWAEACNIVYPRDLLERLDGFYTGSTWGEDTDLAARARRAGVEHAAAPEVLTYHAVEPQSLPRTLRGLWRWQDLPCMVRRNPELRRDFPLGMFWKRTHVWLGPAVAGAALSRRNALYAVLALPYLVHTLPQQYGTGPRGRFRALSELPSRVLVDATEVAALARGSVRHRTLFL